jgi:hypothetical protein
MPGRTSDFQLFGPLSVLISPQETFAKSRNGRGSPGLAAPAGPAAHRLAKSSASLESEWSSAACAGIDDPDVCSFPSEDVTQRGPAALRPLPGRRKCLSAALARDQEYGVWGRHDATGVTLTCPDAANPAERDTRVPRVSSEPCLS